MIPKFRAWDEQCKKMREVVAIDLYHGTYSWIFDDYKEVEQFWENDKIEDVTLMQYTGLNDKNGREIFEGDIVRWKDLESFDDFKIDEVLKVEYSNEFLKWVAIDKNGLQDDLYDFSDNRELEVIGNIYENPELLESKLY